MARQIPPPIDEFFERGREALEGGDDAMRAFISGELPKLDSLAGVLEDAPDCLREMLTSPTQLAPGSDA